MKESRKRLLKHIAEIAAEGTFGDAVRRSAAEYDELPPGIAAFLKVVDDYCKENSEMDAETRQLRDITCQLFIATYRDAKRVSPETAEPFLASLIEDFPGAQESALLTRWCSLAQSCLAMREVSRSQQRGLIWQQMERTFIAYNEFLDGLLGFLIVMIRAARGRRVGPGVFKCTFGNKVKQLKELTGGENGAYYLLSRLARPALRNAAAHGRLWIDPERGVARYVDGRDEKIERTIPIAEFAILVHSGSHLVMPYLAAVGALVVLEMGHSDLREALPQLFLDVWDFEGTADASD